MSADLLEMTAIELLRHYRSRELSPVEVTEAMLKRIDEVNDRVNAYCLVDPPTTLRFAREAEERYRSGDAVGKVDGIPVAVKDVFLTPMWPTLKGSKTVDPESTLDKDAPATAALGRHGYVPLGKTTTPEFGWKGVTDSPLHGATGNPWNPARTSGGSSGGTASALGLGLGALGIGTDAGGSIRIPAGFCGVTGLKPTCGEVPHWPTPPYGTLAHAGPMARTVADCALLMNVLTEPDIRDSLAAPRRNIDYLAAIEGGVEGWRIAFSPALGYVDVNPEVAALVERAAHHFEQLGAIVEEADPGFRDPLAPFGHLFFGGTAMALKDIDDQQRRLMDPRLVEVAEKAAHLGVLDYLESVAARNALAERTAQFHVHYDLLLTPTLPITAFKAGREVPVDWPYTRWTSWTPFTYPFNMTGQPALSVPCGFASDGLPVGLQIIGRRFEDERVLRAGHTFQQSFEFEKTGKLLGGGN